MVTMAAFVPASGVSALSGETVGSKDTITSLQPATRPANRRQQTRMVAYPYTGSGYGSAGIPYGSDRVGQGFKVTTTSDIVDTAASVPIFGTLVSLLQETGLDYELRKGGPFTVFAPIDTAFAALLEPHGFKTLAPLLRPENRAELKRVLLYHVVRGNISSGAVMAGGSTTVDTLAGAPITVIGYGKKVTAGSAAVVRSDVPCTNGVIHVISSVLIPPTFVPQPAGPVQKQFVQSNVLEVYANMLTPRQALGIDPLPEGYDSQALTRYQ